MKNRHTNNYFFSRMLFFGICTFLFILNSSAQKWTETAKRTVTDFKVAPISDRNSIDRFGHGIAISGDYAISGAYTADHDARGMASKSDAGSAYIYKHTAGTWTLEEKIVASDRGANDLFGVAVAISGDYAIVGAVGESHDTLGGSYSASAGSAYIFRRINGVWEEQQKIVASDRHSSDEFGSSVAISGDYAIVGAWKEDEDTAGGAMLSEAGSAYIFKQTAGVWEEQTKIVPGSRKSGDRFGWSVAISGDYAAVGALMEDEDANDTNVVDQAGSVYIYKQTAGVWAQQQKIVAADRQSGNQFGHAVSMSGNYIAVGSHQDTYDAIGGGINEPNSGSAYIFKQTAGVWTQQQKVVASDRRTGARFGYSVAVDGDYLAVGAYTERRDTGGGNDMSSVGAAYIFKQTAGVWAQQNKVVASDRAAYDRFGSAIGVGGDYVIVGAPLENVATGSAYAFKQIAGVWTETQILLAQINLVAGRKAYDYFGHSVAMSGDYAIVGAYQEDEDTTGQNTLAEAGSVVIFKQTNGVWSEYQKLVSSDRASDDRFGYSVAIDGDYAIIGATGEDEDTSGGSTFTTAGAAYIFKHTAGVWIEQQKLVASDRQASDEFGASVAISGEYAIVGANREDHDLMGTNTASDAGAAYIFKRTGTAWTQQHKIIAPDRTSNDQFGYAVALDGNYAVIGAYQHNYDTSGGGLADNAGAVYVFQQSGGSWTQQQKLVAADRAGSDRFGWSVAISGNYIITAADHEDHDTSGGSTVTDAGSVYVFQQVAGVWTQQQKLVASDRGGTSERFGYAVSINGDHIIVSARFEDEDANGANFYSAAGAAYIFEQVGGTWIEEQKIVHSDRAADDYFGWSVAISQAGDALVSAVFEAEDANGENTLAAAGSVYFFERPLCTSDAPIALVRDSTYTASYYESVAGWTNYCADGGELLLSLNTLGSGARINASEVQLKLGPDPTYSYGAAGGLIINTDGYILMDRIWDINPTTQPTTGSVGVRFYFSNEEYDSVVSLASKHVNSMAVASPTTVTSPHNLEFYKATSGPAFARPHTVSGIRLYDSTTAALTAWTYTAVGAYHQAEFLVSSFSGGGGGAGANGAPLPTALIDFHGEWLNASTAKLVWNTATEINNSHFELERSTDAQHWEHIAHQASKAVNGNAHHRIEYTRVDAGLPLPQEQFYYRLRQVDVAGTTTTYDPIVLRREQGGVQNALAAVLLYPNPFRGELTIVHAIEEDQVRLQISDALGRVVHTVDAVAPHQTISLEHLPAGRYHATISSGSMYQAHTILKHTAQNRDE